MDSSCQVSLLQLTLEFLLPMRSTPFSLHRQAQYFVTPLKVFSERFTPIVYIIICFVCVCVDVCMCVCIIAHLQLKNGGRHVHIPLFDTVNLINNQSSKPTRVRFLSKHVSPFTI